MTPPFLPSSRPIANRIFSDVEAVATACGAAVLVFVWVGIVALTVSADRGLGPIEPVPLGLLVGAGLSAVIGCGLVTMLRLLRREREAAGRLAVKQAELRESRALIRRYAMDIERIAEVAAHDLQEPLRRTVVYAQLLAEHAKGRLRGEELDFVAKVVEGARRMRALVKDLEEFVAVERLPPAETLVAAADAAEAARSRLERALADAGASLSVAPLPAVAADRDSLIEVFAQLLDNAVRYREPSRRPMIAISAETDGKMALFSVSDNGIGIDCVHLGRVFEMFARLHGPDERAGTGMGLALVRRLVERQGGSVAVESEPGRGSTFRFTLPLRVAARGEAMTVAEAQAA